MSASSPQLRAVQSLRTEHQRQWQSTGSITQEKDQVNSWMNCSPLSGCMGKFYFKIILTYWCIILHQPWPYLCVNKQKRNPFNVSKQHVGLIITINYFILSLIFFKEIYSALRDQMNSLYPSLHPRHLPAGHPGWYIPPQWSTEYVVDCYQCCSM